MSEGERRKDREGERNADGDGQITKGRELKK